MIDAILRFLLTIRNYERIPKLPRGMLAAPYERVGFNERRVIARLGARCPNGVRVALRRARAADVPALVERLPHFQPRRFIARRWELLIDRALGASRRPPHARQLIESGRAARRPVDRLAHERIRAQIQTIMGGRHD